jgi:hypothetical protein
MPENPRTHPWKADTEVMIKKPNQAKPNVKTASVQQEFVKRLVRKQLEKPETKK